MKRYVCVLAAMLVLAACKDSGTQGKATVSGMVYKPVQNMYVYVYKQGMDLRGPALLETAADKDGNYSIQLPPGRYLVVARSRKSGEMAGPVEVGDIKSEMIGPVEVGQGGATVTQNIKVFEKSGESKDIALPGTATGKKTGISGRILDADGKPVVGARVHVYNHVQMSERPKFVSSQTGPDGRYSVSLPGGGTYYLAARDKFGGPPKVGDLYGRYDKGTVEPSAVVVKNDEALGSVDITVHKVW